MRSSILLFALLPGSLLAQQAWTLEQCVRQAEEKNLNVRNWGVGMSYMYAKLNADVTKSGFNGNLNWSNNSVMLYATAKF